MQTKRENNPGSPVNLRTLLREEIQQDEEQQPDPELRRKIDLFIQKVNPEMDEEEKKNTPDLNPDLLSPSEFPNLTDGFEDAASTALTPRVTKRQAIKSYIK